MFTFMMQPTVNLCYMTSCPSVARKARKHIEEHLQDLAMHVSKWAIIEVPNFVKPDKVNNPHNKDILHFVFEGAGCDVRGEYGAKCKQLAEQKGSWLNRALTSNTLFLGNENAPGLYFVYADSDSDDAVLRACVISNVGEVVKRIKAGEEIM
ncbi:hypothetical protein J4G57_05305 [Aeromonas caviae]|uniref:hypothetical protein n=1 Tax=Aeromonas caviae TaxID=648 RepID=UPI001BD482EE|nr:hypothetical protein [Aeromonas caviae]MBS4707310.1 hypothetical protein [Aeromonas caviae]